MLNLIGKYVVLTRIEKRYLKDIDSSIAKPWDIKANNMKKIKQKIKDHLESVQEVRCAFCLCRLYTAGRAEIEHIAPKGISLYRDFIFHERNLVLACQHCNSSSKKGTEDVITRFSNSYKKCEFSIVHPHFDDPDDHYEWANGVKISVISKNTPKANKSIELFDLSSPYLTEQRAMNFRREKDIKDLELTPIEKQELIKGLTLLP